MQPSPTPVPGTQGPRSPRPVAPGHSRTWLEDRWASGGRGPARASSARSVDPCRDTGRAAWPGRTGRSSTHRYPSPCPACDWRRSSRPSVPGRPTWSRRHPMARGLGSVTPGPARPPADVRTDPWTHIGFGTTRPHRQRGMAIGAAHAADEKGSAQNPARLDGCCREQRRKGHKPSQGRFVTSNQSRSPRLVRESRSGVAPVTCATAEARALRPAAASARASGRTRRAVPGAAVRR